VGQAAARSASSTPTWLPSGSTGRSGCTRSIAASTPWWSSTATATSPAPGARGVPPGPRRPHGPRRHHLADRRRRSRRPVLQRIVRTKALSPLSVPRAGGGQPSWAPLAKPPLPPAPAQRGRASHVWPAIAHWVPRMRLPPGGPVKERDRGVAAGGGDRSVREGYTMAAGAGGARRLRGGRAGEVGEDGAHDRGVLHGGDDPQPAATAGTGEDIEIEDAAHQRGPGPRARSGADVRTGLDLGRVGGRGPGGSGPSPSLERREAHPIREGAVERAEGIKLPVHPEPVVQLRVHLSEQIVVARDAVEVEPPAMTEILFHEPPNRPSR
jgi:hypothetical protein